MRVPRGLPAGPPPSTFQPLDIEALRKLLRQREDLVLSIGLGEPLGPQEAPQSSRLESQPSLPVDNGGPLELQPEEGIMPEGASQHTGLEESVVETVALGTKRPALEEESGSIKQPRQAPGSGDYPCPHCPAGDVRRYKNSKNLQHHIKTKHPADYVPRSFARYNFDEIPCPHCPVEDMYHYADPRTLNAHIKEKHPAEYVRGQPRKAAGMDDIDTSQRRKAADVDDADKFPCFSFIHQRSRNKHIRQDHPGLSVEQPAN